MPRSKETRRRNGPRPGIERLEDRRLLATLTVNTTSDSVDPADPTLSLGEAIEISDGTLAVSALSAMARAQISGSLVYSDVLFDTINFDIPTLDQGYNQTTGVWTIALDDPLPPITRRVSIDGPLEPGNADTPLITISGNGRVEGDGLSLEAGSAGSTISGLMIDGLLGDAIWIGTSSNLIEGNVLSGNFNDGIQISGVTAYGNLIVGNKIGTDAAGEVPLPFYFPFTRDTRYNFIGISVDSSAAYNVIGGTTSGAGNLVSGNESYGIQMTDFAHDDLIEGNDIGTVVSGERPYGNMIGINVSNFAFSEKIGGTMSGASNTIERNLLGVAVGSGSAYTRIEGNQVFSNSDGILIDNGHDNAIGGTASGAGNLILGGTHGIELVQDAEDNIVYGNFILFDQVGVEISESVKNSIGGTMSGAGNTIQGSAVSGIEIDNFLSSTSDTGQPTPEGNLVSGNLITNLVGGGAVLFPNSAEDQPIGIWIVNAPGNVACDNTISGYGLGVYILGSAAVQNTVAFNSIGAGTVDKAASRPVRIGVYVVGASDNIARGNTISGYAYGADLDGKSATRNLLTGNQIGPQAATGPPAARRAKRAGRAEKTSQFVGIAINLAPSNMVRDNTITDSQQAGVYIFGNTSTGEAVTGNRFRKNQYGILLYNAPNNGGYGELTSRNRFDHYGVAPVREYTGPATSTRGRAKVRQAARAQDGPRR
jgi:parallel beta-helix repeat protein